MDLGGGRDGRLVFGIVDRGTGGSGLWLLEQSRNVLQDTIDLLQGPACDIEAVGVDLENPAVVEQLLFVGSGLVGRGGGDVQEGGEDAD